MSAGVSIPSVSLRTATVADAEALLEIYAPYVTNTTVTFEYEVPSITEFSRRITEFSSMYPYIVAVADGRIVGYAYAHRYAVRKAYDWCAEMSVYVDRSYRNRGIGRMLYRAMLPLLTAQNIQNAFALIALPNPASVSFHAAQGFTRVGLNPQAGYKLGRWLDTATYMLPLGRHDIPPAPVIPFPVLDANTVLSILTCSRPDPLRTPPAAF